MAFTIQQLLVPQTQAQVRATMVSALQGLGIPAAKWASGGVASSILTVCANVIATLSSSLATAIQSYFLPTATGGGLQLLAQYVYGIPVATIEATFATGQVTLTNSGGGIYTQAIGTLTVGNTSTGQTYTNTQAFTLNAMSSMPVDIQSTTIGTAGNASPGQITTMVTSLLGVTCSNAAAVVGRDQLSDAALQQLCLNSLAVQSVFGPANAYQYAVTVATNPVTGATVNINRSTVSASSHTGTVTVYVASPEGAATADDITGVITSIENLALPQAVTLVVTGATPVNYGPTLTIYYTAPSTTITTAQVVTTINNALTNFFENYPIGGKAISDDVDGSFTGLSGTAVVGAIAQGLATLGVTLISVAGLTDAVMTIDQVMVLNFTINSSNLRPV